MQIRIQLIFMGLLCFTTSQAGDTAAAIAKAVSGPQRTAAYKTRDQYRHPQQTLDFFSVGNDMTVLEIWPGNGWYTEILAPLLKEHGTYYAAHFSEDSEVPYFRNKRQKFNEKIAKYPDIYGNLIITELQPPDKLQLAPDASVDRVLTFRNVHNWMKSGHAAAVFKAMYQALKPGGMLGVVEHRNPQDRVQDPRAESGYVTEAYVIELAHNAGFKFVRSSEINANPKDTANHPLGVWTLPPALRMQEEERKKYLAIGESDRMTLQFIKP